MAEHQRNFRQEILDRIHGNLPGWNAAAAAWEDGDAELRELDLHYETLEAHEYSGYYIALRSLIIDPNLSADEVCTLVQFAYSREIGQVEPELLALREMPAAENAGLRDLITSYLAYRSERRTEAATRMR